MYVFENEAFSPSLVNLSEAGLALLLYNNY